MNYAREEPSELRKIDHREPYVWQDGVRGLAVDIGPYQCCVRFDWHGATSAMKNAGCALIQVCRADGGSVIDWRDLQQIKNLICGPEWEAVELYPAESRLKDPSNARYMWAFKGQAPFGLPSGRMVLDAEQAFAPQRPFPKQIAAAMEENHEGQG